MKKFPFYFQLDAADCGPSCLRMIAKFYGKFYSSLTLNELTGITKEGVSLFGISEAAERIGLKTIAVKTTWDKLIETNPFPFVVHWRTNHFVVVYRTKNDFVYIADPAIGLNKYSKEEFLERWLSTASETENFGIALLFETTPSFFNREGSRHSKLGFQMLFQHLFRYKKLLIQLCFGLLIGSLLQLIFPFLTQAIVDVGIRNRDIKFIYAILSAQLVLYLSQTSVDFIRSWILLHINTRINISLLVDFLSKLMRLPIAFFESKMVGDIIQRMEDQQRIQSFLTGPALNILFSILNFIIFSVVIVIYNVKIFFIFLIGSILYITWVLIFMKYRRKIDYKRFESLAQNQSTVIEMIQGMQEIKMNTCETQKRWEWEKLQAKVFRVNVKGLELTQYQQAGAVFINQIKNILITVFSATAVVHGEITFGAMLAIQYMVGQLNGPIEQFISFSQSIQDASISMERMNDIHNLDDEELPNAHLVTSPPLNKNITLTNICYKYDKHSNENVLENISLTIPAGKITAIVGESGSGKTTLLKLLMKFYKPSSGKIELGENDLKSISNRVWRGTCGAVMQDNYIFSDNIAKNIAVSDEIPDKDKLIHAVTVANIKDFIESLPLGFNTKIGSEGSGISQGQRQRILIARAVYKNPNFIFFDEATNSLDANNELIIMENLNSFFLGRTVIIAAHRLSTIRKADQIIVLDKGKIVEIGTHDWLIKRQGFYYTLVKNQFELATQTA